jgi:hypothetical protein
LPAAWKSWEDGGPPGSAGSLPDTPLVFPVIKPSANVIASPTVNEYSCLSTSCCSGERSDAMLMRAEREEAAMGRMVGVARGLPFCVLLMVLPANHQQAQAVA